MAYYTKLLQYEIQAIAGKYALDCISCEPIEQGAANSSYLLVTQQGRFILTIFEGDPERITQMLNVLLLLAEHKFPAPRIQNLADGAASTTYQGKPVLLKPYINGQIIENLDADKLHQVGAALSRLHEIPIPDYLPDKHMYVAETYPMVMENRLEQAYRSWLAQRYDFLTQAIPSGLPIGLSHGDLFYDNVLFANGNFKAILDFEEICQCYKVFDLGMAVVGLCAEDTHIPLNKVRAFVNGYQTVRLLEEKEKESLQLFIEYAAILTSAWRFWKYHIDTPDAEKSDKHRQMVHIAKDIYALPKPLFMNAVFS